MEGVVWHYWDSKEKWDQVYLICKEGLLRSFEVDDDKASIPLELSGLSGNQHTLDSTADVLFEQREGSPTNFGFALVLAEGQKPLDFCATSKKELIDWKKGIRKSITQPSPSPESNETQLQREQQAGNRTEGELSPHMQTERAEDESENRQGGQSIDREKATQLTTVDDEVNKRVETSSTVSKDDEVDDEVNKRVETSSTVSKDDEVDDEVNERVEKDDEVDDEVNERVESSLPVAKDNIERGKLNLLSQIIRPEHLDLAPEDPHHTIQVYFDDYELDFNFSSQSELNKVSVVELKEALCLKLATEDDRVLHPGELEMLLGNAILRDYWQGEEFGLHPGSILHAKVRTSVQPLSHPIISNSSANKKLLLTVEMKIGTNQTVVQLYEGDDPELVASNLVRRLGFNPAQALPVTVELYKRLSEKHAEENQSLKNQILELKRRLALVETPAGTKTRETYETLLEKTKSRMDLLESEKLKMSDQLFELRLLNAERLSSETSFS